MAVSRYQPTGGCPHGYADWCLAREIVKTVKTGSTPEASPIRQHATISSEPRKNDGDAIVHEKNLRARRVVEPERLCHVGIAGHADDSGVHVAENHRE